jgi:peroxiredoxin
MNRRLLIGLFLGLPLAASMAARPVTTRDDKKDEKSDAPKMTLKVGDAAPDFTLLSDKWKTVKLSEFRGKKNVFLAVYVLAFTGG